MAEKKLCAVPGCDVTPVKGQAACAKHRPAHTIQTLAADNEQLRLQCDIFRLERDEAMDTPRLSPEDIEMFVKERVSEAIATLLPPALEAAVQQMKDASAETKQRPVQPSTQQHPPQSQRRSLPPPPKGAPAVAAVKAGRRPALPPS